MPATAAHILRLRDDERLTARPIRPDDKDALVAFFARLSPESRRRRFLAPKPRLTARDLVFLTEVDGRAHVALVALDREGAIVGVARYAGWPNRPERADVAFAVADDWHGRGLATVLGDRLVEHAHRARPRPPPRAPAGRAPPPRGPARFAGPALGRDRPAPPAPPRPRLPARRPPRRRGGVRAPARRAGPPAAGRGGLAAAR